MIEEREVRGKSGGMRVLGEQYFASRPDLGRGRTGRYKRRCMHREAGRQPAALGAIGRGGPDRTARVLALPAAGAVRGAVAALRCARAHCDGDWECIACPEGHQEPHGNCAANEAHQKFKDLA